MKEPKDFLQNLIKKDDVIVLSCSGGPDSMCLLSLFVELKKIIDFKLIVAHVNHKVRKESEEEEEFVRKYAKDHNLIFELLTIDNYSKNNFHDEARVRRYNFLKELMDKYHANYLATAHHGDDLIETVLMRIERHSVLSGYAGFKRIQNVNNYQIIRPLITVSKQEIKEYNDANNIEYRIDKTNFSDEYTRNRFRNHVLPVLKEEKKDIHKDFYAFSKELYEYDSFLRNLIKEMNIISNNEIDVDIYKGIKDEFLKRKVIEYYITLIQENNEFYVNQNIIKELDKLLYSKESHATIDLPNNFKGIKNNGKVSIEKISDVNYDYVYNKIYETDKWIINNEESVLDDNNIFRLLSTEIELPIHIRNIKDNDEMEIKNLNGHKKIMKIFRENKIKDTDIQTWPIICDNKNTILGIPSLKKSKFCKDKSEKYDIIINCKEKK